MVVDDGVLSAAELDFIVQSAIGRWSATGLTAEQLAALNAVTFEVTPMNGWYLGSAAGNLVQIDSDAGGFGWFVDATPLDDSEFPNAVSATRLYTDPTLEPAGHIDLLTTVMHELGHVLGVDDHYDPANRDSLMYGYATVGERRLPVAGQADGATPGSIDHEEYLIGPLNLGTLPAGKTVRVLFQTSINSLSNGLAPTISNQGTVSGSNFASVLTDDPAAGGAADPTTTTLDSLTLGNQIWIETNNNSVFNSGTDTGANPIALTLFLSNGTTVVTTGSTNGSGVYQFTGLLPGDYIVRVDASNFGAAQTLDGKVSITGGADPDDNVDNDDNGVDDAAPATNGIRSLPITLAYNTEITAVIGNDTNSSLDIGFTAAPTNTPPVVDLNGAGAGQDVTTAFTEQTPVLIAPLGTLTDADSANLTSLLVTVTARPDGDAVESLSLNAAATTAASGLTVSYTSATGVLSITGSATNAVYQSILQGILYNNTSDNPTTTNRLISVIANDGTSPSATQTVTLTVTAVERCPDGDEPDADQDLHAKARPAWRWTTSWSARWTRRPRRRSRPR